MQQNVERFILIYNLPRLKNNHILVENKSSNNGLLSKRHPVITLQIMTDPIYWTILCLNSLSDFSQSAGMKTRQKMILWLNNTIMYFLRCCFFPATFRRGVTMWLPVYHSFPFVFTLQCKSHCKGQMSPSMTFCISPTSNLVHWAESASVVCLCWQQDGV